MSWPDAEQAKEFCPPLNVSKQARYPGGGRGAAAPRRDGAPRRRRLGLCARCFRARRAHHPEFEVTGVKRRAPSGAVMGVDTTRGFIGAKKVARGGRRPFLGDHEHGRRAHAAGEGYPLQALVSEPVKPVLSVVMFNTVHAYISQSDKGELVIGAGTDQYVHPQTGGRHIAAHA